jgi:hypothetical protein
VLDIGGRLSRLVLDARPLLRELVVLNPYPTKRSGLARLGEDYRVEVIDAWNGLAPLPTAPRFDLVVWRYWCPEYARPALLADAAAQLVPGGTFIDHAPAGDLLPFAHQLAPLVDEALAAVLTHPLITRFGRDIKAELDGLRGAGLVGLDRRWSNPAGALLVGHRPVAAAQS